MSIQIMGLRDFISPKTGRESKAQRFFEKNWRLEKIEDVFDQNLVNELLTNVPQDERYNLYFTVADCHESKARQLKEQHAIPFDVDNLDLIGGTEEEIRAKCIPIVKAGAEALGLDWNDFGVIFSGHGVQFFILTSRPILDESYFSSARNYYAYLCQKIQDKINELGLVGKVDTSVWGPSRFMRFPSTDNVKKNKPVRKSLILNRPGARLDLDVVSLCGDAIIEVTEEHVSDNELKVYPKPDTKAVLDGCEFLKHCANNQAAISEPEWYAATGIWARLDDGERLVHVNSNQHPDYSEYETELKIKQALQAAGPRTCADINTRWNGCSGCKYFKKITSPILIKGPDYVATKDFGFRKRIMLPNGSMKFGPPEYQDLERQFSIEFKFLFTKDSRECFVFNGRYWEPMDELDIQKWFAKAMLNDYRMAEYQEFYGRLRAINSHDSDWFNTSTRRKICFQNAVVDIETGEMLPHDSKYGFLGVLPQVYDKNAKCPQWDKFIDEICEGDIVKKTTIEEYSGYAISGDECWLEKCLVLIGGGANGKSVLLDTLAAVVGSSNSSAVNMAKLGHEYYTMPLRTSLFNYSEESGFNALKDSDTFKTLVTGGQISVRSPYGKPSYFHNRSKLFMAANEFPYSGDKTYGTYRRFLVVHLDVDFTKRKDRDPFLRTKLVQEGPGILNKLIESYKHLKVRGNITYKEESEKIVTEIRKEEDIVYRFSNDTLEFTGDDNDSVSNSDLYLEFDKYCHEEGVKAPSMQTLSKRLRMHLPDLGSHTVKKDGRTRRHTTKVKMRE